MKYNLINACCDLGVNVDGSNLSPSLITSKYKNKFNITTVNKLDIKKSYDVNDLEKNLKFVNEFNKRLYDNNLDILKNGEIPITIGGDHSVAIASALSSIKYNENLGIIWIDSHGDFNNFKTTTTGNLHGLPFASITNYPDTQKLTSFHDGNFYKFKNSVLVGARDIDDEEMINLKKAGITIFTTDDIKNKGVDYVMDKAYEIASNGTNGIHISYDIDVIDPEIAPGVSVKAINGINEDEAYNIMKYIKNRKDAIKSLDVVEYNPLEDINKVTLNISWNLLNIFFDE